MELNQLTYLFSILIFAGSALLAIWSKYKKALKKHEILLMFVVVAFVLYTPIVDYFALRWGAWSYSPDKTSNIYIATVVETYLFAAAIALVLSSATIVAAYAIDKNSNSKFRLFRLRRSRKRHR